MQEISGGNGMGCLKEIIDNEFSAEVISVLNFQLDSISTLAAEHMDAKTYQKSFSHRAFSGAWLQQKVALCENTFALKLRNLCPKGLPRKHQY